MEIITSQNCAPTTVEQVDARYRRRIQKLESELAILRAATGNPAINEPRFDSLRLSPMRRRIVEALWAAGERGVSSPGLMEAMYYDRPDCDRGGQKILHVYIFLLRRHIANIGAPFSIETIRGHGYRIREIQHGREAA